MEYKCYKSAYYNSEDNITNYESAGDREMGNRLSSFLME